MKENWDEFVRRVKELSGDERKVQIDVAITTFMDNWRTLNAIYIKRLLTNEAIEEMKTKYFDEYREKLIKEFGYAGVL